MKNFWPVCLCLSISLSGHPRVALLFPSPNMTSDGISKSEMPVSYTENMGPDDNIVSKGSGAGAAGWAPEKRARVEKSMKRKLDARCSLSY